MPGDPFEHVNAATIDMDDRGAQAVRRFETLAAETGTSQQGIRDEAIATVRDISTRYKQADTALNQSQPSLGRLIPARRSLAEAQRAAVSTVAVALVKAINMIGNPEAITDPETNRTLGKMREETQSIVERISDSGIRPGRKIYSA